MEERLIRVKSFVILFCFWSVVVNGQEEYCFRDMFQPKCFSGEVIVIEEANFGRKVMGKCLSDEGDPSDMLLGDPKFLGCYVDVRKILEPLCSGREQCDVSVAKIDVDTPCHKWTKLYLEIKHSCLKVVEEKQNCKVSLSSEKQYIIRSQDTRTGCGSSKRPWVIDSQPGQKIKLGLVQFSTQNTKNALFISSDMQSNIHEPRATIIDASNKEQAIVYSGLSSNRGVQSFESSLNSIEVIYDSEKSDSMFVISLEATGCSDLIPPADAWLKRIEDEAIIGCYSTRLRWQLKCIGQRWIGVIGNCSQGAQIQMLISPLDEPEKNNENSVVTIVAIAMVGFVICFLIICTGVVFLNRYYALSKAKAIKQISSHYNDPSQTLKNCTANTNWENLNT